MTRIIQRCISGNLTISDFPDFKKVVKRIFLDVRQNVPASMGKNADYILQLKKANPNSWGTDEHSINFKGVSICTIDGQRFTLGDVGEFGLQSCVKPFIYAVALETRGIETVHSHVGKEPSGLPFNSLTLNADNKPHNPMINSGAIITSSLLYPKMKISDKFEKLMRVLKKCTGGKAFGFDNSMFQSEKETADGNYSTAYMVNLSH